MVSARYFVGEKKLRIFKGLVLIKIEWCTSNMDVKILKAG